MKAKLFLIVTAGLFIQALLMPAGAQVWFKGSVNREKILIGEPISFSVELRAPLGSKIEWTAPDSIPGFVITEKKLPESKENLDGKIMIQQYMITSFDSGHQLIPSFRLKVNGRTYASDTIGVDVTYAPFDASEDYRQIKEIETVEVAKTDERIWIISALTLLILAVIVYLLIKRKAKPVAAPESKLSPFDEAMKDLEALQKQGETAAKPYYTKLNDIIRRYLLRRWQMTSLQQTNDELVMQMTRFNLPKDDFKDLQQALRTADFVKFARYQPDSTDNDKNFKAVQSAITLINNRT